jgi:hypothetical protein
MDINVPIWVVHWNKLWEYETEYIYDVHMCFLINNQHTLGLEDADIEKVNRLLGYVKLSWMDQPLVLFTCFQCSRLQEVHMMSEGKHHRWVKSLYPRLRRAVNMGLLYCPTIAHSQKRGDPLMKNCRIENGSSCKIQVTISYMCNRFGRKHRIVPIPKP